ncbi:MAG: IS200/IS605 family accessory protein TnpB-related protein [Vulcanimicrobiaceae bacterium]
MRTYQTRIALDDESACLLDAYGEVFGRALRALHAQRRGGAVVSKSEFMRLFDLTSRQYNAVTFTLDGMESSIRELRPGRITDLKHRIKAVAKKIEKEAKPAKVHHLKRRLASLRARLDDLQNASAPRLCFGSRKLFNAQHHLAENGFASHAQWRDAWKAARDWQFFVLGSKDETAGCQGCVLTHLASATRQVGDDRFAVRLRLNGSVRRYVSFEVRFAYGAEHLAAALRLGQAISYRFVRDAKGWRMFASTKVLDTPVQSRLVMGCVGVDLNVGFVSVSETDRCGNIMHPFNLPLLLQPASSHQAETAIAQCVKEIVAFAVRAGKPISIERLDFAKKKAQLSYARPRTQRMLSSFSYRAFERTLVARAYDAGVEVLHVNPAYSSKIGRQKYARRYGLSVHLAAALVLARRAQKFRDRYVSSDRGHSASTCKDGCGHVPINAKETERHRKSAERSSQGDPRTRAAAFVQRAHASDQSDQPGGTPGRESPAIRVRPAS